MQKASCETQNMEKLAPGVNSLILGIRPLLWPRWQGVRISCSRILSWTSAFRMDNNWDQCFLRQECPWVVGRRVGCRNSDQPVVCVLRGLPSTLYLSKETVHFSVRFLHLRFGFFSDLFGYLFSCFRFGWGVQDSRFIGSLEYIYVIFCHFVQVSHSLGQRFFLLSDTVLASVCKIF